MKSSILITGVSGTGKTTTCIVLEELGYAAIDIESVEGLYELVDKKTGAIVPGNRDQIKEGLDWNCNREKLEKLIQTQTAVVAFYCGGMANTEEIWNCFSEVVIMTVSDETTLHRLGSRSSGEFGSTAEDREWVLSWKHDIESQWLQRGGIEVSAESSPREVAKRIVEATAI